MASITSLTSSSSSTSSIYGTRNILSGLASGLDTETLIENSVAGYKTKIQQLLQKQTKLTWKQDAYRSIIDKMAAIIDKYTSYTSKTNLMSQSFFNNAIKNVTSGTYADLVSATGRTSSTVKINSVKQLATAASYNVSVSDLDLASNVGEDGRITGDAIDWNGTTTVSDISGSITVCYENNYIDISFGENEKFESAQDIVDKINETFADQTITLPGSGGTVKASENIRAVLGSDGTTVKLEEVEGGGGGSIYISSASGDIKDALGINTASSVKDASKANSFTVSSSTKLSHEVDNRENLSGKTISVTLDGTTKTIEIGDLSDADDAGATLLANLQSGLKKAFGDKVTVEMTDDGALSFGVKENNSSLKITSSVSEGLGLGTDGVTSYLDTSRTLGDLLGSDMGGVKAISYSLDELKASSSGNYVDSEGNSVRAFVEDGVTNYYRVDSDGNKLYDLKVNDVSVGTFTKDTALETVMLAINNSDAGVTVNYSQMTNMFTFKADETGETGRIDFESDSLGTKLFGEKTLNKDGNMLVDSEGNYIKVGEDSSGVAYYAAQKSDGTFYRANANGTLIGGRSPIKLTDDEIEYAEEQARKGFTAGTDAKAIVTVNGQALEVTRSSNIINIDGLSVTLSGTFNSDAEIYNNKVYLPTEIEGDLYGEPMSDADAVSFTTKADADTIVDAVKSFVEEINAVLKEVHDAYSTMPNTDSSYNSYDPLTDEDKADMSESEIAAYEEKAKQGLLFADSDLSRLYSLLRTAMTGSGTTTGDLRDIGITSSYSEGLTTINLDEDKLREALEANPDKVKEVFSNSTESGSSSDGLMVNVSKVLKQYASTTYGSYGILVKKAGTKLSTLSLNDNYIAKQISSLDDEIDKWQTKMSNKIDYYTKQFTALETLMNELNSQSSALASLTGSY